MAREQRIPSLDGLRAISIALVLAGHLTGVVLPSAFGYGAHFGVCVFFVISGFLITGLLIAENERTGGLSLRRFYLRRALRIFPAVYVFLLGVVVLRGIGLVTFKQNDLLAAATYTVNYRHDRAWTVGHLWSLAVEEQFYLLWPAALALLGLRRGVYAAVAAVLLAPVVRIGIYLGIPAWRGGIDETFPTVADALATGCLLALLRPRLTASAAYLRFLASPAFVVVPIAVAVAVAVDNHPRVSFLFGETVRNVGIALVIDRVVRFPGRPFGRFLNARPVAAVGVLSYSLYLWQQPFLGRHASHWMNRFPQNVALAIVCAALSYTLVERPVLALRDRARRGDRRRLLAPAVGAAPPLGARRLS